MKLLDVNERMKIKKQDRKKFSKLNTFLRPIQKISILDEEGEGAHSNFILFASCRY